jgi:hypothetical protein
VWIQTSSADYNFAVSLSNFKLIYQFSSRQRATKQFSRFSICARKTEHGKSSIEFPASGLETQKGSWQGTTFSPFLFLWTLSSKISFYVERWRITMTLFYYATDGSLCRHRDLPPRTAAVTNPHGKIFIFFKKKTWTWKQGMENCVSSYLIFSLVYYFTAVKHSIINISEYQTWHLLNPKFHIVSLPIQTGRSSHICNVPQPSLITLRGGGHYATSWKIAGSISNGVIGVIHWFNLASSTMAMGLTQPLKEISTRDIFWKVKAASLYG